MNKVTFKILTLNKKAVIISIGHHHKGIFHTIPQMSEVELQGLLIPCSVYMLFSVEYVSC